jgi:hypothetical protein
MTAGGYDGQLVATRLPDGEVRIDQADPRIRISTDFVDEWGRGASPSRFIPGDVLRIHAANRTVIYRVDEVAENGDLLVSWPD